jgi:hypothetical protein
MQALFLPSLASTIPDSLQEGRQQYCVLWEIGVVNLAKTTGSDFHCGLLKFNEEYASW